MRYRQVGAAAGVVAVVVTGVPGSSPSSTLALLSDQAVVAGSAQAAVLSLEVRVDAADGQPLSPPALDGGDTGHVEVTVTGELDWQLTLQLLRRTAKRVAAGGPKGSSTSCPTPAPGRWPSAPQLRWSDRGKELVRGVREL